MDKDLMPDSNSSITNGEEICPDCGSSKIETTEENYSFTYGQADDKVDLSVKVPIQTCKDCGASFLDHVAEEICHNAVCRHLGVMTPSQIKALRKMYSLTQAQFCDITKLGEATLSRWERGIVIQNEAYNNYLYLLGFPENLRKLQGRDTFSEEQQLTIENGQDLELVKSNMLRIIPTGSPTFRC